MPDGLKLLHRVGDRMQGFMAGHKTLTRAAFHHELEHNLSYEASFIEPRPAEAELDHVRDSLLHRYAARLTNF